MTIRDLLAINTGWFNDYITISNDDDVTILKNTPNSELHPKWLDYEVKSYYMLPHKEDEIISVFSCDYLITIYEKKVFQDKTTEIDEALNERIKDNESTNNN